MPPPLTIESTSADRVHALRALVLRDRQPADSVHFAGDDEPDTLHLIATPGDDASRVVGCVSLMRASRPDDPAWTHQLRGMAVNPDWQASGVGSALLAELHRRAGSARLWCNARVPARRFYERHGWVAVGETFDIAHHGPHVRMVRQPAS